MRSWTLSIAIDPRASIPIFTQIARSIAEGIHRGRLRPGAIMPGTRALARTLGVHRNTVIAAYQELTAEGWITSEAGRGTFVSSTLPDPRPRRFAPIVHQTAAQVPLAFELAPSVDVDECPSGTSVSFNLTGWPDLRMVPTKALARAWRRSIEGRGHHALAYGTPQGHPRLRAALASMLNATRGLAITESGVLITRGTQGALAIIAHGLLRPGDVVAVEDPGYRRGWQALTLTGARLAPIAVDAHGLSTDALAAVAGSEPRLRAVFVTPHHQCPTTVTLSPQRRLRLLELARLHRFAIIEDDYDHEFHYEGRPILPIASADASGSVIYVGSLSKTLAPGLRLGYIAAPADVIGHLTGYRVLLETQGDPVLESAVAELLEDGEVHRHIRRMRRLYRARRDAMAGLLASELGDAVRVDTPVGGTALWVRVAAEVDIDDWRRAALEQDVLFESGDRFAFDCRPLHHIRVGYAGYRETELAEAVRRLARALAASHGVRRVARPHRRIATVA